MIDVHVLVSELQDICADTLLNKEQKDRFIETTVFSALWMVEVDDLPTIKAVIRISRP